MSGWGVLCRSLCCPGPDSALLPAFRICPHFPGLTLPAWSDGVETPEAEALCWGSEPKAERLQQGAGRAEHVLGPEAGARLRAGRSAQLPE